MLRTVGKFGIVSLAGSIAVFAFWGLVDPFAPKVIDGLITGALFAIGWMLGYAATRAAGSFFVLRRSSRHNESPQALSA